MLYLKMLFGIIRHFVLVVLSPGGSRRCRAASKEVSGGQGKPRAPERWPESSGRGLENEFQEGKRHGEGIARKKMRNRKIPGKPQ